MNLLDIFGNADGLKGLLSDEQLQGARSNAMLQAGLNIMAASQGGQPGSGRAALFPALLQGLQSGQQAFKGDIENKVGNLLTAQKVAESKRQQAITAKRQQILANADPTKLSQAFAAALQSGDIELAKTLGDQIKASRQVLKPGEMLYEGNEVIAQGAPDPEKIPRYTGAYGNLALSMFGTNRIDQLDPNQRATLDKEAQRRQLERPPSTVINMPSESERTAGFLTQRLDMGLKSLAGAVGADPKAAKPNMASEIVGKLTGSAAAKNMMNDAQRQVVEAAQLEVLDSALTLGTGAAYTREQLEAYRNTYFPQIGDTPEVVKDKQKRLQNLLGAARIKSGRATPTDFGLPSGVTVEKVK
jgi:hypothetical protein